MKMVLGDFQNGGYRTILYKNGTKERRYTGPSPLPLFPETIDLKITDYCNAGCKFCHENSTLRGKHGNLNGIFNSLQELPAGVEIALGGGNPLDYPRLGTFLDQAQRQGLIVNITVNEAHARQEKYFKDLIYYQQEGYIHGVGISPITNDWLDVSTFSSVNNLITHYILGRLNLPFEVHKHLTKPSDRNISRYLPKNQKMLFLGFKNIGRGESFIKQQEDSYSHDVDSNIAVWRRFLVPILKLLVEQGNTILFDNLAIKQLRVKEQLPELWKSLYMGPDGMFSMFIDGVQGTFSKNSTTPYKERTSWDSISLLDFFQEQTSYVYALEGY